MKIEQGYILVNEKNEPIRNEITKTILFFNTIESALVNANKTQERIRAVPSVLLTDVEIVNNFNQIKKESEDAEKYINIFKRAYKFLFGGKL